MIAYELISQCRTEYLTDTVVRQMMAADSYRPRDTFAKIAINGDYLIIGPDVFRKV
jgi:hypothetical protein